MEQINRDALFCDETEDYRCPSEADAGEVVTFYFRTEKNGADAVVLLEYDPETRALLEKLLTILKDEGEESAYAYIRKLLKKGSY